MARSSVKEVWNEKERKQTREGDLLYISTYRGIALSLSLLSFSFFPVSFFSLFVSSLLPVHLEKASPQSTLYSAAAPARTLAGILL